MMKSGKEFDNILNDCLEQLLVGGGTVEQCLASYPEQAAELRSLLQMALAAKEALDIQPRAEFKARARYQFRSALEEVAAKRSRLVFGWLPQWAAVAVVVLGLMLVGGGTVTAASYSMPDEPLYSVKLAAEQVQLTLTFSDMDKAGLYAELADMRVKEIIHMANKGDVRRLEDVTERMDRGLVKLAGLVSAQEATQAPKALAPAPEAAKSEEAEVFAPPESARDGEDVPAGVDSRTKLRMTIARYAVDHQAALQAVLEAAPESAKSALRHAIAVSVEGYERALEALD